jgi:hypothetical protein
MIKDKSKDLGQRFEELKKSSIDEVEDLKI